MRAFKVTAVALVAALAVAGCGKGTHTDAPEVDCIKDCVNGSRTQVIQMPDGFRNVVFTCYGTNGIYVTSRGGKAEDYGTQQASGIFVLPNDPHCV